MKAVRLQEYGGQLEFHDVPAPTIARDEVLVKTRSTAVNHLDLVEASGSARQILPIDLPWIPGHEFSGVVEQIGSDVAAWAEGDAVFGTTTGVGAYAEYVAVKAAAIARKPSNLSFEEAASVPVASQTAWQGIFTHGHLEKGQTILVHGGAAFVVMLQTAHFTNLHHSTLCWRLYSSGLRCVFVSGNRSAVDNPTSTERISWAKGTNGLSRRREPRSSPTACARSAAIWSGKVTRSVNPCAPQYSIVQRSSASDDILATHRGLVQLNGHFLSSQTWVRNAVPRWWGRLSLVEVGVRNSTIT